MFGNIGPVGAKNLSLNLEELVQKYQVKIKGLIHVGAHYGQEYEIYQKLGIVDLIFFEPLSQNFEILKTYVGEKAKLFQLALGNENKKVKMYIESANNGMSSSILKPQKHLEQYPQIVFDTEEIVEMVRLDDFLSEKENYNFLSDKKKQLKEKGKKYARMLSSFAYSQWNEALNNACLKQGIYHKKVNPAYSSLIGLTKFMSMYGMNSAPAAAFVIARRGRRFSERLPQHQLLHSKSAYAEDTKVKHVWSHWSNVCKSTKGIPRHKYFQARLNRTRKVTSFCQLTCSASKPRQIDNLIVQLELFEAGVIPAGNDAVSVATSRSRKRRQRSEPTFTQLCLDLN